MLRSSATIKNCWVELVERYLPELKGRVAQWIRAFGYEPKGQGFKSLLAHFNKKKEVEAYGKRL